MSKWDKIMKRDSLQAFPCVADLYCIMAGDDQCEDPNFAPCPDPGRCALRPIYKEYLALRDVVEAMFVGIEGMRTPQHVIKGLRGWRDEALEGSAEWRYYQDLAEKVEAIA